MAARYPGHLDVVTEKRVRLAVDANRRRPSISDTKRFAIYCPPQERHELKTVARTPRTEIAERKTLYDYNATVEPSSFSSGDSTLVGSSSHTSALKTPAQDIVDRYRATDDGKEYWRRKPVPQLPDQRSSIAFSLGGQSTLDMEARPPRAESPQIRRDPSSVSELEQAAQEAALVMRRLNLHEDDSIPCQRSGCHDVLPNVKALKFHLHIHIISDGMFPCSYCENQFENGHKLGMHVCPGSIPQGSSGSPRKRRFKSFFSKFCCCL